MELKSGVCELIGRLLAYPGAGHFEQVERCLASLTREHPDTAPLLRDFVSGTQNMSLEQLRELYTRTFDLNPVCTLEVGWQLYGEEYSRGSFLVNMRGQLRRHGIPESAELPDHLTHVLSLLDKMTPAEAREFSTTFVMPALEKMLPAFRDKRNPYENILRAIDGLLQARQACSLAEVTHD